MSIDFSCQPAPAIESVLNGSPYQGYSYSYPHKTAYRQFSEPVSLRDLWSAESTDSLFLYLHIPFCEYRCGFCNLFTQANPEDGLTRRYLEQIRAEAQQVTDALGEYRFARLAIGGGTPTFLTVDELTILLELVTGPLGVALQGPRNTLVPASVEVSPPTIDRDKLALLAGHNIERISIGVQSFAESEVHQLGRPQKPDEAHAALSLIREFAFPRLNIDLIYGGEGQSVESFLESIDQALIHRPEEIYLYPLYVRPLTGLGRLDREWDDQRLTMYREARQKLLGSEYRQNSMRMFERVDLPHSSGPAYCCQTDGMIGLGVGARSYTAEVHYSTEYAVGRTSVKSIIADYLSRQASDFASAQYGYRLPIDDQRRRFALQSLLQTDGLDLAAYESRFGASVFEHLPQLGELIETGLAGRNERTVTLTSAGLEWSDAVGPWLYSARVRELMSEFDLQ